jgi:diaminopimelate epimerase
MESTVTFYKMQGCGNDFVLVDNRSLKLPVERMAQWARAICPRAVSVGADGLIFLDDPPPAPALNHDADYIWHFYNADGSRAEMCGNASRCAARLAVRLGTDAGPILARVMGDAPEAKVLLTSPRDLEQHLTLNVDGEDMELHFVNTGVPHVLLLREDVATADVMRLGRALRFHQHFAPAGTNVNFGQVVDRERMLLRTYERGVEAETLACGTGAAAAVVLANALGLTGPRVEVTTTGKEVLTISLEQGKVFLQGKALLVYEGKLQPDSLGLSL